MRSDPAGKVILAIVEARENIHLIQAWASGQDLVTIRADRKTRYAIERAFFAIDAAIRDIPGALLAAHAIPAKLIAGFLNARAHTYDDILDERVMLTIRDDLPALDEALQKMLDAVQQS
jgi:uncharacterized protein with HEPN domain